MKFNKNLLLLLIFLIFHYNCEKDKRKPNAAEKKRKNLSENVISDSINTPPGADDFTVNVINSKDGLISNNIKQIMFENESILLLSEKGITRIHKKTGRINYVFIDNNANFTYGKIINKTLFIIDKMGFYKFSGNKLILLCKLDNIIPEIIGKGKSVYFLTSNAALHQLQTESTNATLVKSYSNITFDHVFQDGKNILLSSGNILYDLNIKTLNLTNIISIPDENINYAIKDENKFYFGSRSLYEFNEKTRITTKIISIASNDFLTYLYKEGDDLYIGKNKGISLVDIKPDQNRGLLKQKDILKEFAVKDSFINYITRDENIIWISTKNNGVIKYIE